MTNMLNMNTCTYMYKTCPVKKKQIVNNACEVQPQTQTCCAKKIQLEKPKNKQHRGTYLWSFGIQIWPKDSVNCVNKTYRQLVPMWG